MKQFFVFCMLAFCLSISAKENCPKVIPALQEWKGLTGKMALAEEGSIVIAPTDEVILTNVATILVQDLKDLLGWQYTVKTGKPCDGDIYLSLMKADKQLGEEGYVLSTKRYVSIEAPCRQGVFWGTRSLLQILHNEGGQLPKGVARDWPEYPKRGFMLDCGRKFFTMDFLRKYVKILAFYKLNEFQVHLNDNAFPVFFNNDWKQTYAAFRLESERFPGLTAKDGSYTKKEFTDLQRLGMEYGVNVIPEIDVPAHSLAFTHYKPEIASDKYGMDHLDIYNEETYKFLDELFDEYLSGEEPVFIGPDVHIGTDEYNKKEVEQFRYFTDRYLKYIEKYGKNARMWGSLRWMKGNTPVKSENVTINAWAYEWSDPATSLKEGYKVINTWDRSLYIVPSAGYYHDMLDARYLYEEWRVGKINDKEELPEGTPGLLGGMFALWNDHKGNGITQQDVHYRTFPAAQVLAEKMWRGKNEKVTYDEFAELCKQMPEAPGVNLLARVPVSITLPGMTDELTLNGKESINTSLPEIGYPYSVSFEINPAEKQNYTGILFKGPNSIFHTNWDNTGKLAFSREGYTYVFHTATIVPGKWTKVRIEGDWKGTTLYINDKEVERLEGRVRLQNYSSTWGGGGMKMYIQETLIFPMQQIGDGYNGFNGKIRNIRYQQK